MVKLLIRYKKAYKLENNYKHVFDPFLIANNNEPEGDYEFEKQFRR